jgi:hypothetical protein
MRRGMKAALAVVMGAMAAVAAAPSETAPDSVQDTTTFTYSIELIDSTPGESGLSVSGDTISFVLYFIDTHCSRSVCTFERRGRSLYVRRRPADSTSCRPGSDYLYRLQGWVRSIPPGRYWFELVSHCAGKAESLLKEAVAVGGGG